MALVFAPIMEEIVFRGFLTPFFRYFFEKIGIEKELAEHSTVGLTSIIFGSAHSN
ncbi:CAAX amino terminal protease self- immunity [Legionella quinlivanii]|uniref:CAAX amino terminal protease self-immunity n=1 Tax=Legionella quinlivanii TaxID=45073 RepID=A0A0W0Y464_9GAMM|nr:CAAX amino terminal protease self- immunity [Legionella quinlivanii]SEG44826.1 CAAX protease self-immunity [Legionella quinlivanii DSM 21216]STY11029.1 CAAX amino terminal protease self- immunity [Legionella quinlivanii]